MKRLDIVLLILFPILTTFLSLFLNFNFLLTSIFFFVLPSIYLSLRTKNVILRNLIFVLPFAICTGVIADYILVSGNAWFVPTIFSFKILGKVTVEELVWYSSLIYFCIVFYEHFQDNKKHILADKHFRSLASILSLLSITFITLLIVKPSSLNVSYAYFLMELVLIISIVLIFIRYPKFSLHLFRFSLYFIFVSMLNLTVGVKLGNWIYTGDQFVGWVRIFDLLIPYEEVFLALILWIVAIEYFEFFDDRKHLATSSS